MWLAAAISRVVLLLLVSAGLCLAADSTRELQESIDKLPENGVLDCQGSRFTVSSLKLKSKIFVQNCWFDVAAGSTDLLAAIEIDGRREPKTNIVLRNVHISGNRHEQRNIGYAGEEDGGRHCFRLIGRVTDVVIEDSSGEYCAGDGIALVSYRASTSDAAIDLPFQNITLRSSQFSYNRRHGGSADGVHGLTFDTVTFTANGTTIPGGAEGDACAADRGECYGTGFWYEDYLPTSGGEGLDGLVFSNCVFRGNYRRSLFFYSRALQTAPGWQPRQNIRILNSYLDAGVQPLAEDYAVQFQVEQSLVGKRAVFEGIVIQNSTIDGSLGFRQVEDVLVNGSRIRTRLAYAGYSANSSGFRFNATDSAGKLLHTGPNTAVNYVDAASRGQAYSSAAPLSGSYERGDVVWNLQGDKSSTGWVCLAGGEPLRSVAVVLSPR